MTSNYLPVYHIDTLDILPPASYKTIGIEKFIKLMKMKIVLIKSIADKERI